MESIVKRDPVTVESLVAGWEQKKELANVLLKSRFLPQAFTTPEQVIAVMLKGQELNIPPMEALSSINVIQGKPTVSPQLMLALVRRTGELSNIEITKNADSVTVTTTRKNQSAVSTTFGVKEASALGLIGKDNYKKQPHTMYQWRAVAANLRLTFPDVICGMYTPEEMGASVIVDEDQNMITVGVEEVESKPETVKVDNVTVGQEFDPSKEVVQTGKHQGSLWAQVPIDYLTWASGKSGALKIKAEATLAWLKRDEATRTPEPDITKEMFPEVPLYDVIESELSTIAREMSTVKLVEWGKANAERIHKLSKKEQDIITKAWQSATKEAKKVEASNG